MVMKLEFSGQIFKKSSTIQI